MNLRLRSRKQTLVATGIVVLVVVLVTMFFRVHHSSAAQFTTAKVNTGAIRSQVSATGTLRAINTVQICSQVSGTISAINADFNSRVSQGQVLVQLDRASYEAEISQARASLEQARANLTDAQARGLAAESEVANERAVVSSADADLAALRVEREDASDYLRRERDLSSSGVIADRELEAAQNSFQAANARYDQVAAQIEQARANEQSADQSGLAEAQAIVREAQAQIGQNEAAIRLAQANLDHTTIRSPIDGVVVSRNVDVGQTVAASLQTPILFTIAGDLSRMQVIANIDQADIGAINTASQVNFTVDTYPGENFTGVIQQIRLSPQDVDNVVTYNVVIDVANPQLKLKPGMTANLVITYAERDDVLRIPSAALGFTPAGVTLAQIRDLLGELPETTSKAAEAASLQSQSHIVWVLGTDHKPQARKITLGITDGINTEVTAGGLEENDNVITGQASNSNLLTDDK